jgi:hypothetical protein
MCRTTCVRELPTIHKRGLKLTDVTSLAAQKLGNCCGAVIFQGFGADVESQHSALAQAIPEADVIAWLDKNEKHQRGPLGRAVAVITLNDRQNYFYGALLKKQGYIRTRGMYHPKYSTRVYLFFKPLQEDQHPEIEEYSPGLHRDKGFPQWNQSDRLVRSELYPDATPQNEECYGN